jgi:long-chain fatty acid transport protein
MAAVNRNNFFTLPFYLIAKQSKDDGIVKPAKLLPLGKADICWREAKRQVTCWLKRVTHAHLRYPFSFLINESKNMDRRHILKLLAIMILEISALKVSANGFLLADQDAFATARGEAFVATADNSSAIYYNPAGISQLEGNNLRSGIYGISLDPSYNPPGGAPNSGQTYHSSEKLAAAPQLFYAYTPKDSLFSFGLGVYAPYGGKIDWPQDTGFRAVAYDGSLTYLRFNPVIALKLSPNLSIGGGVMMDYAKIDMEQGLLADPMPFVNYFRFKGDGWDVGYNLGLLWRPYKKISLGVTFRSATTIAMDGHTEIEQQPVIPYTRLPASADFTFPLTAVFGFSYRPTPKWNLEFDADYADWGSFGTVTISQQGSPPYPVQSNIPVKLDWQASWLYEFGVTRYFDNGWHMSAGYIYDENSVPDAYYTPLAADLDRHFFSVGSGFKGKRFNFDVAYQLGYGPAYTVTGSQPSSQPGFNAGQSANGTYHFISDALMVTVGMRF